jgi:hypothetical protein
VQQKNLERDGPATMGTPPTAPPEPQPWLFFIILIIAAIAISSVIAYLGLTGQIGAGIAGSKSPSGVIAFAPLIGLVLSLPARREWRGRS